MTIRMGINGFGRIGRQVYKAVRDHYNDTIDVVAVNDIGSIKTMTHLLKYDTNFGTNASPICRFLWPFVAASSSIQGKRNGKVSCNLPVSLLQWWARSERRESSMSQRVMVRERRDQCQVC
jgi:hypothetical protein